MKKRRKLYSLRIKNWHCPSKISLQENRLVLKNAPLSPQIGLSSCLVVVSWRPLLLASRTKVVFLREPSSHHIGGTLFLTLGERYWQEIDAQDQTRVGGGWGGDHWPRGAQGKVAVIAVRVRVPRSLGRPATCLESAPSQASAPQFPPHRLVPGSVGGPFLERLNSYLPPPPPHQPFSSASVTSFLSLFLLGVLKKTTRPAPTLHQLFLGKSEEAER